MAETRALLLTDVVDSTRLSEALGDEAMAALWARHDRVARDLLVAHEGLEIDKTDGFLMLFGRVRDAVAYALAYHRALHELDIAARAGIHFGEVILTENAPADVARGAKPLEVDGIAKPTAARVMSLAGGGQTLLTPAALEDLGPTELRLQSHGHWRMKGVSKPVELFEVGEEDAPFVPPPDSPKVYRVLESHGVWVPVREVPHNLPGERDVFVGREHDLDALAQLFDEGARLVSLLGVGGTGKTRLVRRFGWSWLGDFPGGVWLVDLTTARSARDIVDAAARALDVRLGSDDGVPRIGAVLGELEPALVILDNFEQVADHAAETLGAWLDAAPEARFVATTREVLGLSGEAVLPLAPLDAGTEARPGPAVELFLARGRTARRGWSPTDEELADVLALVQQLDGIPLAIELAAARLRVLSVPALTQRLGKRFKLLGGAGRRGGRQATLLATIDWSWQLLQPWEQAAMAQCSVFVGSFDLEDAEAVLDLTPWDEAPWPMDAVQTLVDKSLLQLVPAAEGEPRFRMLVSLREFAEGKLADPEALPGWTGPEQAQAVESRHGAWFSRYAELEYRRVDESRSFLELSRALVQVADEVHAAARRAIARKDSEIAVRCLICLNEVWQAQGQHRRQAELGDEVLALELDPDQRLAALSKTLGMRPPTEESTRVLREAFAATDGPDPYTRADTHITLGYLLENTGHREQALEVYEAGEAQARAVGGLRLEARLVNNRGICLGELGRLEEATELVTRARELAVRAGDLALAGGATCNLAINKLRMGAPQEEGAARLLEAAEMLERAGHDLYLAITRMNLASALARIGRQEEAADCLDQAIRVIRRLGKPAIEVTFQLGACLVHAESFGDLERAREALGAAAERGAAAPTQLPRVLHHQIGLARAEGRPERAAILHEHLAEIAANRHPTVAAASGLIGARLAVARGDVTAAVAFLGRVGTGPFERASSDGPGSWGPVLPTRIAQVRTALCLQAGDPEGARAALDTVDEDSVETLALTARLLAAEGDRDAALRVLDQAREKRAQDPRLRILLAEDDYALQAAEAALGTP